MQLALIVTTAVSVVLAAAMAIVAWRMARAERLRSAARVAALTSDLQTDLHDELFDLEIVREPAAIGIRPEPDRVPRLAGGERRPGPATVATGEMFRAGAPERSGSSLATVLTVGGFAVAAALALVIATSRVGPSSVEPVAGQRLPPAGVADAAPLELVSLSHDRDGDRITIHGIVRNPRDGANVDPLTAAVYLFDREGEFLKSGAAPIDAPALVPGAKTTFAVTVDQTTNVGRYRVSFKSGDRIVPHVDRRLDGSPGSRE